VPGLTVDVVHRPVVAGGVGERQVRFRVRVAWPWTPTFIARPVAPRGMVTSGAGSKLQVVVNPVLKVTLAISAPLTESRASAETGPGTGRAFRRR
jgi:hypothetical protein